MAFTYSSETSLITDAQVNSVDKIDSGRVVLAWLDDAAPNGGTIAAASVTPAGVTVGTELLLSSAVVYPVAVMLTETDGICVYADDDISRTWAEAVPFTVSGTAITLGTAIDVTEAARELGGVDSLVLVRLTDTTAIVGRNEFVTASPSTEFTVFSHLTLSGGTLTKGADLDQPVEGPNPLLARASGTSAVFLNNEDQAQASFLLIGYLLTVSDTTLSASDTDFHGPGTANFSAVDVVALPGVETAVFVYADLDTFDIRAGLLGLTIDDFSTADAFNGDFNIASGDAINGTPRTAVAPLGASQVWFGVDDVTNPHAYAVVGRHFEQEALSNPDFADFLLLGDPVLPADSAVDVVQGRHRAVTLSRSRGVLFYTATVDTVSYLRYRLFTSAIPPLRVGQRSDSVWTPRLRVGSVASQDTPRVGNNTYW